MLNGISQNIKELYNQNDSIEPICKEIDNIKLLDCYLNSKREDSSFNLNLYKRLLENSNDNELYKLTSHGSPMVKIYAYFGLNERNKVLLMAAIRNHDKDTSKVNFSNGQYYEEIHGNQIQVNHLAIWIAYWGFYSRQSITLNNKDWKYIQKKYYKVINNWRKEFIEHSVSIKGKAVNHPQGAIIKLENGNYYFIENKSFWEKEIDGKEIQITGEVKLYKSNIFQKIRYHRYIYRKYTPGGYVITPQGAWIEIYKKIELRKIEIINIK